MRWIPKSLAGRFLLLLALALIIANLMAAILLGMERNRADKNLFYARQVERIASVVSVLDELPPADWRAVVHRASNRFSRFMLRGLPIVEESAADAESRAFFSMLSARLRERNIRVVLAPFERRRYADKSRKPDERRAPAISVSILVDRELKSPQWLNFRAFAPPRKRGFDGARFLLILAASLISVLGAGYFFIRRLIKPLGELANAARRAGSGDRTVRVAEEGPAELKEVAHAFNDMQARISRFDSERLRTLAAVGHDLRTPLTSLRIRAELLDAQSGEPIIQSLDEMTVMADSLVEYAKGSGDGEDTVLVDLSKLLDSLCAERGAALVECSPVSIWGRPVGVKRAIGNMIDNAIRYGSAARVSLHQRNGKAIITVEDDGPGIPPEQMETAFEPFMRGEGSRSRHTGGAGLGLSIAKSIVMAHGGAISLNNLKPRGLCVEVELPCEETSDRG